MRWTRKSIIAEIKRLHEEGEELSYSIAEDNHLNLVRAAAWHYGTWRRAVEAAGIDYESLSRYQRWSKKRIVERIRELHAQGHSLHWHAVSTEVDPPLAAAALRSNGYQSWREAIAAAGLHIEDIARYKEWDEAKVIKAIRQRKRAGLSLCSRSLQSEDQSLFCAARRRFGSWDSALEAAGLDADKIRLRRYNPRLNAPRKKRQDASTRAAGTRAASTRAAGSRNARNASRNGSNNGHGAAKITIATRTTGAKKSTKPSKRAAR